MITADNRTLLYIFPHERHGACGAPEAQLHAGKNDEAGADEAVAAKSDRPLVHLAEGLRHGGVGKVAAGEIIRQR